MTTHPRAASATGLPSSDTLDLTLLRARAADAVDRLLDLLDWIDGDADYELTATESRGAGFLPLAALTDDDEDGHDAEALEYPLSAGGRS